MVDPKVCLSALVLVNLVVNLETNFITYDVLVLNSITYKLRKPPQQVIPAEKLPPVSSFTVVLRALILSILETESTRRRHYMKPDLKGMQTDYGHVPDHIQSNLICLMLVNRLVIRKSDKT